MSRLREIGVPDVFISGSAIGYGESKEREFSEADAVGIVFGKAVVIGKPVSATLEARARAASYFEPVWYLIEISVLTRK